MRANHGSNQSNHMGDFAMRASLLVFFVLVGNAVAQNSVEYNFNGSAPNVTDPFYHQEYITPKTPPNDALPVLKELASEEDQKWLLSVSARLNIWDKSQKKYVRFGSATLITPPKSLRHLIGENEYLLLSVGHVCEGNQQQISIYAEPVQEKRIGYECTLLGYNKFGGYGDVALMKFRSEQKFNTAEVVQGDFAFSWDQPLVQVGCPNGNLPEVRVIRPLQVQHRDSLSWFYFDPVAIPGQSGGGIFDLKNRKLVAVTFLHFYDDKSCAVGPGLADEKKLVVRNRMGRWGAAFFANDLLTFDREIVAHYKQK